MCVVTCSSSHVLLLQVSGLEKNPLNGAVHREISKGEEEVPFGDSLWHVCVCVCVCGGGGAHVCGCVRVVIGVYKCVYTHIIKWESLCVSVSYNTELPKYSCTVEGNLVNKLCLA